jgi:cytidylate kinase
VAYELGVKRKISVDSPNILEKFNEVFKNFKMDDYSEKKILRAEEVNLCVSLWAELPIIREELFWVFMCEIHNCDESVVCVEGRDVTTFLCRAGLSNWFVTCSLDERARRRNIQNENLLGFKITRESLVNRDLIDSNRMIRPCYFDHRFAKELDNENTSPSAAFCVVINHSSEKVLNWKREIYQQDNVLEMEDRFAERSR